MAKSKARTGQRRTRQAMSGSSDMNILFEHYCVPVCLVSDEISSSCPSQEREAVMHDSNIRPISKDVVGVISR